MTVGKIGGARDPLLNQDLRKTTREDFKELLQKAQATDGEKLRQAAQDMEGVFLKQLVEQMWRTIPKESRGQQAYYEGLFLEELAKILGETGGIGLADFIVKEMEK
ncbi:MAG: rod-binding protein [Limnochordia bacterium]|jgi:Rod binding domain-containing protein